MSGPCPFAGAGRRSGVALLLLALVVPAFFAGLGEAPRAAGPEAAVLVAPDSTPEEPDRETSGNPLLLLFPAGIVGPVVELPDPLESRLEPRTADHLAGAAVLAFIPPPPRRA